MNLVHEQAVSLVFFNTHFSTDAGTSPLATMPDGRILQIFRDGKRHQERRLIQLPAGAQANFYTLGKMAEIVRQDAREPGLRAWAMRTILGNAAELDAQIDAAFQHCRDDIVDRPEGPDTETIADLWSCEYELDPAHPIGDCAIKSVALATLISLASSLTVKPVFIALRQIPGADYFNHVLVGIPGNGQHGYVPLDPTPPEFRPGDMLPSLSSVYYRIFK